MQDNPTITGSGFNDVLTGAEMFDILRIESHDLASPVNASKVKDIADFTNAFQDAVPRLRQIMHNKPADISAIDYAFRYTALQKKRLGLQGELDTIKDELALYES